MEHYYKSVPSGWFNYERIYQLAIERAPKDQPSHFVELGVWFGQSMCFAGVEIINSGKNIRLDGVDSFLSGDQPEANSSEDLVRYNEAIRYTEPVSSVINLVKADSVEASKLYKDESLDFIYIDANHTYEGVIADIKSWYPKLKPGGIIGGHDYNDFWDGLVRAVHEVFGEENIKNEMDSWIYYKK